MYLFSLICSAMSEKDAWIAQKAIKTQTRAE